MTLVPNIEADAYDTFYFIIIASVQKTTGKFGAVQRGNPHQFN